MGEKEQKDIYFVPGLAILGCFITGIEGLIMSYKFQSEIALVASAISFGIIVYVSYKK